VQSQINDLRVHVYGHTSADPDQVAAQFGAQASQIAVAESDLAIFAIDPSAGIDQATIDLWQCLDEYQVPRLVVVTHLEKLEADFDDAVMIATRVFDQMITPFLVLHDEDGMPAALIGLFDLQIIDYSTKPKTLKNSEEEHQTLVQEFRDEYLEQVAASGDNAFSAGLLFPAIPLWIERGIGVDIVNDYIRQLVK
jgi:peptide subunit release factor RF-3